MLSSPPVHEPLDPSSWQDSSCRTYTPPVICPLQSEVLPRHPGYGLSRSNANDFQIFSEDRGAFRPRSIVRTPERFEFMTKSLTALSVQRRKRLIGWSI